MNRYTTLFERLHHTGEKAFVPFAMLGDPDCDTSRQIIEAAIAGGADALELGLPFSDPVADGVAIQQAHLRALNAGVTYDDCLQLIAEVRAAHPEIPIGLLVYGNIVFSRGLATFYKEVHEAGADSVLVPDVPLREAAPFIAAAREGDIDPIFIAPPKATEATLAAIAEAASGYVYAVSRNGVTGTDRHANTDALTDTMAVLRRHNAPPVLVGFGISTPTDVADALATGADGAISGSALAHLIAKHQETGNLEALTATITGFVDAMKAATRPAAQRSHS